MNLSKATIFFMLFWSLGTFAIEESKCYGTQNNGHLESGWQLPTSGNNFSAYSLIGVMIGRNYVHSKVYRTVIDAYAILEKQTPLKVFIYGESGWHNGGKFRPHKTHQNGLSVDFFVPVVNSTGQSVPLPISLFNKFGYGIEFTGVGHYQDLNIDYAAMSDHLFALEQAANKNGVKIWRVIFDNALQKELFKLPKAGLLRKKMQFSTKKPWVRHDEHYHIDFIVPCNLTH